MTRPAPAPEHVEDVVSTICAALAEGTPASIVHRKHPEFPRRETVWLWRQHNPEVERRITQAREDGWDMIAWRCRAVAAGDESAGSSGDVKRDKLIVETDLKLLAKWDPKRYGDRVQVDGTMKHEATDMETMATQLVTQVTMNPTLRPVLADWLERTLERVKSAGA